MHRLERRAALVALACAFAAILVSPRCADAHGLLTQPPGRPYLAFQDSQEWPFGPRQPEWNPHSMNRGGVCGTSKTDPNRNYNFPKDVDGNPFDPPVSTTYVAGGTYAFEFVITSHHLGHVELRLCRDWKSPTQDCFDAHPLTFVSDEL